MLDLVKGETERVDSRFLEPACGSGNFLVPVLQRKLAVVEAKFGRSDFEKRHYALLALACCYGIELLPDNISECRADMSARLSRATLVSNRAARERRCLRQCCREPPRPEGALAPDFANRCKNRTLTRLQPGKVEPEPG